MYGYSCETTKIPDYCHIFRHWPLWRYGLGKGARKYSFQPKFNGSIKAPVSIMLQWQELTMLQACHNESMDETRTCHNEWHVSKMFSVFSPFFREISELRMDQSRSVFEATKLSNPLQNALNQISSRYGRSEETEIKSTIIVLVILRSLVAQAIIPQHKIELLCHGNEESLHASSSSFPPSSPVSID